MTTAHDVLAKYFESIKSVSTTDIVDVEKLAQLVKTFPSLVPKLVAELRSMPMAPVDVLVTVVGMKASPEELQVTGDAQSTLNDLRTKIAQHYGDTASTNFFIKEFKEDVTLYEAFGDTPKDQRKLTFVYMDPSKVAPFEITIKTIDESSFPMEIEPGVTVGTIRETLALQTDTPFEKLIIDREGEILLDDTDLYSLLEPLPEDKRYVRMVIAT